MRGELGDKLASHSRVNDCCDVYRRLFVFSFSKALKGIGAWEENQAAAGRRNYGWGPQGMWEIDGVSFILDDEVLRVWLSSRLYRQASKIVAYHNEDRHCVEWSYPYRCDWKNAETLFLTIRREAGIEVLFRSPLRWIGKCLVTP